MRIWEKEPIPSWTWPPSLKSKWLPSRFKETPPLRGRSREERQLAKRDLFVWFGASSEMRWIASVSPLTNWSIFTDLDKERWSQLCWLNNILRPLSAWYSKMHVFSGRPRRREYLRLLSEKRRKLISWKYYKAWEAFPFFCFILSKQRRPLSLTPNP